MEINLKDSIAFAHGACANLYKYDEIIYKKYYRYIKENLRMSKELFKIVKELNNEHTYKLLEIYLNEIDETVAYTYYYIEKNNIDLLTIPSEYIIKNYFEMKQLVDILTDYQVELKDIKKDNTIITNDSIIFIDMDCFKITKENKDKLKKKNIEEFNNYFKRLLIENESYKKEYLIKINELIEAKMLTKTLSKHSSIINYLNE